MLACDLIWTAARFGQLEATIGTTTLLGGVQRLVEHGARNFRDKVVFQGVKQSCVPCPERISDQATTIRSRRVHYALMNGEPLILLG